MKYFYLSPDRKPQGPYSAEELRALHASGVIADDTYAAAAGDPNWKAFRDLSLDTPVAGAVPPPVGPRALGACPFCKQDIVGMETPAQCPHCGKTLHPGTGNLWFNFLSCMRRYVCFRGRASRTEFWSFYLFYFLITLAVGMIWKTVAVSMFEFPVDLEQQIQTAEAPFAILEPYLKGVLVSSLGEYLFPVFFYLPFWGVTARRLHDIGHSITGLVLYLVSNALVLADAVGMGYILYPLFSESPDAEDVALFMQQNSTALGFYGLILLLSCLILIGSFIYLLVCALLPGKAEGNKYGPSLM